VIQLESSALLVDILPEVGGKIAQIHDKGSQCDLLIPPQRPYRPIPIDGDWLKHDTSGMDDCFPNVAAGAYPDPPWSGAKLPDLGEWTHLVWSVEKREGRELVMRAEGHALPYTAIKAIRFADERTLHFSYNVMNHGPHSFRYLWLAHPLISVREQFELQFPPGDLAFQLFPPTSDSFTWPNFKGTRLSNDWIPSGTTLKIFVTGFSQGTCELVLPNHTLRFAFDPRVLPSVGIWFNNFGFPRDGDRPFRCIAVEPCTTPSDLLDHLGARAYPQVPSGATARWEMQLTIQTRGHADHTFK
jgi:hypothetical protein